MTNYRYKKWQDGPVVSGQRNTYKVFLDDVEIGEVSGTYYPFEKGLSGGFGAPEMNGRWDAWAVCPATGDSKRVKQRHETDGIFYKRDWAADAMIRYRLEALNGMPIEEMSDFDRNLFVSQIRHDFDRFKSVEDLVEETGLPRRQIAILLGRDRFEGRSEVTL
jgi:hypothetical protein